MKYLAAIVLGLPLLASCNTVEGGYHRDYVQANRHVVRPGHHVHREENRQNMHHRDERSDGRNVITMPAGRAHDYSPANVHSRDEHGHVEHSASGRTPKAVLEEENTHQH